MIKITIAIIVCATLFGCAGSCITLGGTYKDAKGEITWCKDAGASVDVGRDVLKNNDTKEQAILLTDKEAATITNAITMQQQANIKSQTPFKNLLDFLKTKK